MSAFRPDFYEALQSMQRVTNEPLLTDILPVDSAHNISARILRHGIAVSAFAMLEHYVKSVFAKMVTDISESSLLYSNFPERLRNFIVVESISGLMNSAYFIKDNQDKITFMETNVDLISKYKQNPPVYTNFGFSPSGSNVGHEDVKRGFQAFGVRDAWGKMTAISTLIGASYLSLENEFRALSIARHSSAHDPAGNIPTGTLQANLQSAIILGIAADLLGQAVGHAIKVCSDSSKLDTRVNNLTHTVRFLDEQLDGTWGERPAVSGKIIKKYPNKPAGVAGLRARKETPAVIVRNSATIPFFLA